MSSLIVVLTLKRVRQTEILEDCELKLQIKRPKVDRQLFDVTNAMLLISCQSFKPTLSIVATRGPIHNVSSSATLPYRRSH